MRYPAYTRYKPSGVEWLGDVPEHWHVTRLGYLTRKVGSGKTPRGGAETYQPEGVLLIRSQNVHDTGLRLTDVVFIDELVDEEMAGTRILPGDVLLNITGASLGRCSIAPQDLPPANVNQHVCIVRVWPNGAAPQFIQRAISSQPLQQQIFAFENGSSREGLNFQQVRSLRLALPAAHEQLAIAAFLDRETAKIDTLVAKKRTLIERLKEKRIALISHSVTRGLPPDAARAAGLNPHPRLKPSGIDWLGDVPEHWAVQKFSRAVRIAEGQVDPEAEPFASMLLVAPNHIESGTGRLLARETAATQGAISGKYMCRKGEVIYSKIRPALAKATLAPEDCLCSADMYPLTPFRQLSSRFLLAVLLSSQFTAWSVLEADRVAMPKINRETLNELRLPLPPLQEQQAIADFLDRENAKVDRMLAKVEVMIERLLEYRTSVITAAVTGKIDVQGALK